MIYTTKELKQILKNHELWLESDGYKGKRADLRKANLRGVNFYRANLARADLREVDFSGADLRESDLRESDLSGANLNETNLCRAYLTGANLNKVNLNNVILTCSQLENTNIYTFILGKDLGFYHEGYVTIDEKRRPINWWVKKMKKFGKKNFYSKTEIKLYQDMINFIYMKIHKNQQREE